MELALEYDAVDEHGHWFCSPQRHRLIDPDLRSRVYGYLATAPVAAPGFRTDGVWVWPESTARTVAETGCAPQRELLEHLARRDYLLPDTVEPDALTAAARASAHPAVPPPAPSAVTYHVSAGDGVPALRRIARRPGGPAVEQAFGRGGWEAGSLLTAGGAGAADFVAVSASEAAAVLDHVCRRRHGARLAAARESAVDGSPIAWARVYDGESPGGTPWFSPRRLRIPEAARRDRLAAYLSGGRLVMRAAGAMVDPLDPRRGPVVPMSYRTDGVWVWQEALAYYVRARGVAPELAFLCHIEERGLRPPAGVDDDAVAAALATVRAGPPAREPGPSLVYHADTPGESGLTGLLVRAVDDDAFDADVLGDDLRWTDTDLLAAQRYRGSDLELVEITEAEAVAIIDRRWAARAGPA